MPTKFGTSVVAEVLASAGTLHKEDLEDRLQRVERMLNETKVEIVDTVQRQYAELLPSANASATQLRERFDQLSVAIDSEAKRIQLELDSQTRISQADISSVKLRLSETNTCLDALNELCEFVHLLLDIEDVRSHKGAVAATELALLLESKLENIGTKFTTIIPEDVLAVFKQEFTLIKEQLEFDLIEVWKKAITLDIQCSPEQSATLSIDSTLFTKDDSKGNGFDVFKETLNAMELLGCLQPKLRMLADALEKHFCLSIIRTVGELDCKRENSGIIKIKFLNSTANSVDKLTDRSTSSQVSRKAKQSSKAIKPSPEEVLENLRFLFSALQEAFNFELRINKQSRKFLALIGDEIAHSLLSSIIQECLKPAVPSEKGEQEAKFEAIMALASSLAEKLKSCGFLPSDSRTFLDYAGDLDTLFVDKKCGGILAAARDLVRADFHNTILYEPAAPLNSQELEAILTAGRRNRYDDDKLSAVASSKQTLKFDSDQHLPSIFQFPSCRISSSIHSLYKLIISTLDDAVSTSTSEQASARLIQTARNVCEIYTDLVLIFHRQNVENVPLFAAVFYNNSMFLAHHLATLGFIYGPKLQKKLPMPQGFPLTFVDFIPRIRQLAAECMDLQLEKQRHQLLECLKAANGFASISEDEATKNCDRALRQSFLHLQQLHRVWKEALVPTVLFRSVGLLTQFLLGYLCDAIVKMEDIASDDAKHIGVVFSDFLQKLESLFSNEDGLPEIQRFCELPYHRFKELLFVLEASLSDISDRWAAGKGPLAVGFNATDVKSLVRALFQNTERRAQVLAQIK